MDTERDPGRQEGIDLTGTGSMSEPIEPGMPGSTGAALPPGSAEVRSRMTQESVIGNASGTAPSRSSGMEEEGNLAERGMERARNMAHEAEDRVREVADEAGDRLRDVGERASEAASQARRRAAEALDQAEDAIEEQTGLISTVRSNPLPALGIAFGLGFFLAGSDSGGRQSKRGGTMHRAMDQAKGAIMGAISAAAAEQVRSMLGKSGADQTGEQSRAGDTAGRGTARH